MPKQNDSAPRVRFVSTSVVLWFVATMALFFRGPFIFPNRFHLPHDFNVAHYPWASFIGWSLRQFHQIPWWNPFSFNGEPFAGNVQAAIFYPPKLLTTILAVVFSDHVSARVLGLEYMFHVVLAGLGAYVLLRVLGANKWPAVAGATTYQIGATFASQAQHLGLVSAAGWLPWYFAAIVRCARRPKVFEACLVSIPLAMMILAGHPPTYQPALVFGPLLFLAFYFAAHPWGGLKTAARPVALLALAIGLGVLLSAASWLPVIPVAGSSVAFRNYGAAVGGYHPDVASSFVWPNLYNQFSGEYWREGENPIFTVLYQGIAGLVLVLAALSWLAASRTRRFFLIAAALALAWVFGRPMLVAETVYSLAPAFVRGGFHPVYVLPHFCLFFGVLLGLALSGYETGERERLVDERVLAAAGVVALVIGMLTCAAGMLTERPQATARALVAGGNLLLIGGLLGVGFLILRGHATRPPDSRRRVSLGLCLLIVFDLVVVGSGATMSCGEGNGEAPPWSIVFLKDKLNPDSLYRFDSTDIGYIWRGKTMLWRMLSTNGLNPLLLTDTVAFRTPYSSLGDRQFDITIPQSPLVDLSGARYIITNRENIPGVNAIYRGGEGNVFENPRAFPRCFLVGGVTEAPDTLQAARLIHEHTVDASRVAIVGPGQAALFPGVTTPAASAELGTVSFTFNSPNELRFAVETSRPAALVVTDTFWPEWRASVDGAPVQIAHADGPFRAVPVPAGKHEVRMWIVPLAAYAGGALSIVGLALIAGLMIVSRPRRAPLAAPTAAAANGS